MAEHPQEIVMHDGPTWCWFAMMVVRVRVLVLVLGPRRAVFLTPCALPLLETRC